MMDMLKGIFLKKPLYFLITLGFLVLVFFVVLAKLIKIALILLVLFVGYLFFMRKSGKPVAKEAETLEDQLEKISRSMQDKL